MTYLYLPKRAYNWDAIDFYLNIVVEAFERNGEIVKQIDNLDLVQRGDNVIVSAVNDSVRVILKKRGVKIYTWYQGVVPEEMAFTRKGLKAILLYVIWTICEFISLWGSQVNIYVSQAMATHYKRKYCFFKKNYVLMPCFNQDINRSAFVQSKYDKPSFVYSGSIVKWQCFEETVKIFAEIQKNIPEALFSVFTPMIDEARFIIDAAGLTNVELRNVPYKDLPSAMNKFKYGFLIRQSHILNKVATPTKMSSYIGSGIIPVFSPVMADFDEHLGNLTYVVKAGSTDEIISKIKELESQQILADDVLNEFSSVFNDYYSREKYVKNLAESFRLF